MTRRNTFLILRKTLLLGMLLVVPNSFAQNLKWTQEAPKRMNWFAAKDYCAKLDARLPTHKEIRSVWLNNGKDSNIDGFDLSVSYWTSKEEKSRKNAAHPFYFGEGKKGWYYKADHYGVRCIKNWWKGFPFHLYI